MKYQELKLKLKFHALFILYTYTSVNNNSALQIIILLKRELRVVTASNALFELCLTFLLSNAYIFACCSEAFHFRIALNLLKLCPF